MMPMSPEAVNLYLVIWQNNLFSLFACPYLCGSASKCAMKTEPQLVIPPKTQKNHRLPPVPLRTGINICLTTADPCLPIIAWKCNNAYVSWSSQLLPSNLTGQSFLFICLFLSVWLCLKMCFENRGLVMLLQIGAKDLTVNSAQLLYWGELFGQCFKTFFAEA